MGTHVDIFHITRYADVRTKYTRTYSKNAFSPLRRRRMEIRSKIGALLKFDGKIKIISVYGRNCNL